MLHMNKIVSPPTKLPRVSVPVTAEVFEVYQRLAKAGHMSTGRAMSEWLKDTMEAAELLASTMEKARSAPQVVASELHAMLLGMTENTDAMSQKFAKMGRAARGGDASRTDERRAPPAL
jgi:hypothetical protein